QRMVLTAAGQGDAWGDEARLDALLKPDVGGGLWGGYDAEVVPLTKRIWTAGGRTARRRLLSTILDGDGLQSEAQEHRKRLIAKRLKALQQTDAGLPRRAQRVLSSIEGTYGSVSVQSERSVTFTRGPLTDLTVADLEGMSPDERYARLVEGSDDWAGAAAIAREFFQLHSNAAIDVLRRLATENAPQAGLCRTCLHALASIELPDDEREQAVTLASALVDCFGPDRETLMAATGLIPGSNGSTANRSLSEGEWALWDRVAAACVDLAAEHKEGDDELFVRAERHPASRLTEALILDMFAGGRTAGDGIPGDFAQRLEWARGEGTGPWVARIVLARRAESLSALDPGWFGETIAEIMKGPNAEWAGLWSGFAQWPCISPELWAQIGGGFIEFAAHPDFMRLSVQERRRMADVFAIVATQFPSALPQADIRQVLDAWPSETRSAFISRLGQELKKRDDDQSREELWRDRVRPCLLEMIATDLTADESCELAKITISSGHAFRDCTALISESLKPYSGLFFVDDLAETTFPETEARSVLRLISSLRPSWRDMDPQILRKVLKRIVLADPATRWMAAYQGLDERLAAIGIEEDAEPQ
ncbi:MAG: hypothetical protein AAFQ84_12250, partial [Pseudomonadota bacterium]